MSGRHLAKDDVMPAVDPSHVRLYLNRFCPYAHRTRLVLEHKKISYEMVLINLTSKPDWLHELNPFGLVPILQHKGSVIYESAICNEFLEEAFPGSSTGTPDLMPSCPYRRAVVRLMMFKIDKVFSLASAVATASDAGKQLENLKALHSRLEEMEQHIATSNLPYLAGAEYGMADLHLYPIFERFPSVAKLGVDVLPADKFPRLMAWMSALQKQDCVRKCWLSTPLHDHYIAGYKIGNADCDVELDEETIAMQNSVT